MTERIALTTWQGRISPVFDGARTAVIIDVDQGNETNRREITLNAPDPVSRAEELADLGVRLLICGAISAPFSAALESRNIRLIPFVSGEIRQVIASYLKGVQLPLRFGMPGCGGHRRRQGKQRRHGISG